jgi:hydrogenase nickel incorporation protein HypA/HybF
MHELSIVMGIVDIAEAEAEKAGVDAFDGIELEIGKLSGVMMDALDFAWPVGVKNSVLEQAELKLIRIEPLARCNNCGKEFAAESLYDACPDCGGFRHDFIKGKELKIKTLTYNH